MLNNLIKKNEALDQKFLFKKNFIPKQKPVMINKTPNPPLIMQSDLPINAQSLKKLKKKSKKNSKSQNQSMVFGPTEGVRQVSPNEQMQPGNLER